MLEQTFRPKIQNLLIDPVAEKLCFYLSAMTMTVIAGLFGLLFMPALLLGYPVAALLCLLVSAYCDVLDGSIARQTNQSSALGTVADIMMDRVVELTIIFSFYLIDPVHRGLGVILMLSSSLLCITSFLVVGVFTQNNTDKTFYYSPGLIERAEAFLFFIAMTVWPAAFIYLAYTYSFLVVLTAAIRISQFFQHESKFNC